MVICYFQQIYAFELDIGLHVPKLAMLVIATL